MGGQVLPVDPGGIAHDDVRLFQGSGSSPVPGQQVPHGVCGVGRGGKILRPGSLPGGGEGQDVRGIHGNDGFPPAVQQIQHRQQIVGFGGQHRQRVEVQSPDRGENGLQGEARPPLHGDGPAQEGAGAAGGVHDGRSWVCRRLPDDPLRQPVRGIILSQGVTQLLGDHGLVDLLDKIAAVLCPECRGGGAALIAARSGADTVQHRSKAVFQLENRPAVPAAPAVAGHAVPPGEFAQNEGGPGGGLAAAEPTEGGLQQDLDEKAVAGLGGEEQQLQRLRSAAGLRQPGQPAVAGQAGRDISINPPEVLPPAGGQLRRFCRRPQEKGANFRSRAVYFLSQRGLHIFQIPAEQIQIDHRSNSPLCL